MISPCRLALAVTLAAALPACSDDEQQPPIDAAVADAAADAPAVDAAIDAPTIDAPTDAAATIDAASSVQIISCTGITPDATITTSGLAFSPANVTITASQVIKFTPVGSHDMTSGTGGASPVPDGIFATTNGQEACLRFTAAGSFPYYCSFHPQQMTGTVTVN